MPAPLASQATDSMTCQTTIASERAPSIGLKRITLLCAAGGFLDGYDLLIMGAALLLLVPAFGLSGSEVGILAAVPFIAMAAGALVAGRLCDRFGRRRVYLVDVILFLVFAILQALAQDLWQLVIARLCVGFAIGVDMPTGSSMLAEFAPTRRRGALTSFLNTAWIIGGCVATIVGYGLYRTGSPDAWRWMFGAAAVPALLIAVLRHGLPETPYWDRSTRRPAQAAGYSALLDKRWRGAVIFFTLYWAIESFAGGPPFIYTALIFQQVVQFDGAQALLLNAGLLGFYAVISTVVQFTVLDRWGRKKLAALACTLAGAGAITTAFLPHGGIWLVAAFTLFASAVQVTVIPFWPWSVELLPTRLRATGQSIGSAGGKLGLCAGVMIFSPSVIAAIGWLSYFLFVGCIFLSLVVFVLAFGRETKGKPMPD